MRFSRLTLSADLPHSWIWWDENGSLYLSSLPLSLPLYLASDYFECCPFYSGIKYVLSLCLFSKLKNWRKIKPARVSTNRDSWFIRHKKPLYFQSVYNKIKEIKEQMPNKLIKLENNKFKDFACGILGWNDFNILLVRYQNWKTYLTDLYLFFLLPCYSIWFIWSICFCHRMQNGNHLSLQSSRSFNVIVTSRKQKKRSQAQTNKM